MIITLNESEITEAVRLYVQKRFGIYVPMDAVRLMANGQGEASVEAMIDMNTKREDAPLTTEGQDQFKAAVGGEEGGDGR